MTSSNISSSTSSQLIDLCKSYYSYKFKLLITFCSYYLYVVFGITLYLPPTALLDLTYLLNATLKETSHSLTLKYVAYSIGSLGCSSIFKLIDRRICLIVSLMFCAIGIITLPYITSVPIFMVSMFLQGLTSAILSVGANAVILNLWNEHCNMYMQGLHASFGLGMAISPSILGPFLGLSPSHHKVNGYNSSDNSTIITIHSNHPNDANLPLNTGKSVESFQFIFILSGLFVLSSACIQIALYVAENYMIKQIIQRLTLQGKIINGILKEKCDDSKDLKDDELSKNIVSSSSNSNSRYILILGSIIFFIFIGMEVNSFTFVTEFIHYSNYDIETAAYQSTLMSASYALFRFIGIYTSTIMSTETMIIIHMTMLAFSGVILFFFSHNSLLAISIGLFLFGAGCSVIFAAISSVIEAKIKQTDFSVSLFIFCGAVSLAGYPLIVPYLLEWSPQFYVYNIIVSTLILFICVYFLLRSETKIQQVSNTVEKVEKNFDL